MEYARISKGLSHKIRPWTSPDTLYLNLRMSGIAVLLNAQTQIEHQGNCLLYLEAALFLHYNKHLESIDAALSKLIEAAREEQNRVNLNRKSAQDQILGEPIIRNSPGWQIYRHCEGS